MSYCEQAAQSAMTDPELPNTNSYFFLTNLIWKILPSMSLSQQNLFEGAGLTFIEFGQNLFDDRLY